MSKRVFFNDDGVVCGSAGLRVCGFQPRQTVTDPFRAHYPGGCGAPLLRISPRVFTLGISFRQGDGRSVACYG